VPIRLAQVADVRVGPAPMRGTASYRGTDAVVVRVAKQPGADTLQVTREIDRTLDELEPSLRARGVALHRDLFRQADFIETAVGNLVDVLRDGAFLVVALLFLFLWSLRPTIISGLAIPLSILAAVLVLEALGLTLDTMTLGGLAIAVGELVDDAIVDVENVTRRLRERALLPEAERPPVLTTVLNASKEIRSSIVSATAILALVFLPLLFLEGLEGRLLRPLGIAFLVAIGASLLVAVTVTPVLCSFLLPGGVKRRAAEPPAMLLLGRGYRPILTRMLDRPWTAVSIGLFVAFAGGLGLLGLGRSFLPAFNEGGLTIELSTMPGTSLEQSDDLGELAERALLSDPAVVSTSRRTGRAENDEHVMGVESSEIEVHLGPDPRSRETLLRDLREGLSAVPGIQFEIGQPISHRIDHMISGQRSALAIKVVGDHLPELRRVAREVHDAIEDVPGLVDLRLEQSVDIPQLVVRVDREAAASYGLSAGHAARDVSTALWGTVPMRVYEEGTTTNVVVRYSDDVRDDLESVRSMRVPTPSGALVPVRAFADVRRDAGPNYVMREDVRRRVTVTANTAGEDLRSVYDAVRARIDGAVERPEGVHIEYSGQFEREESALLRLLLLGLIAMLGIALVVATTIGGVRRTLIILLNLPLSLAGGVVGVYAAGGVLSVATTIGFITLFGIATRNGILLATRAGDLEQEGLPRRDAVERAARERLAPILMTAVTAALGLLPLALALGEPGSEIQAPMALVILFGLATSTALNMLIVPPILARWGGSMRGRASMAPPAMRDSERESVGNSH
jgi:CzcA family heavy metal efflux pump